MTKMKSKKMNKSTFAIVIMAIVMVAILAFGGTYAYFTANAVGEDVRNIKTAQLELHNLGIDGQEGRLMYDDAKQVVPGDYVYGKGILNPTTTGDGAAAALETQIEGWQRIHLDLGRTNAAAYAFVTITVKTTAASGLPLMVGTDYVDSKPTKFSPVLRLIPRLGVPAATDGLPTPQDTTDYGNENWYQFTTADDSTINASTYVFCFKLDEPSSENEDYDRNRLEQIDFQFALQFDPAVMADRAQVEKDGLPDRGEGFDNRAKQIEKLLAAGYIQAMDYTAGGAGVEIANIYEKTNVFEEKTPASGSTPATYNTDKCASIMGVNISFKMEFQMIQQTGFNNAADAYRAVRSGFGSGKYTDDDLKPGWDTEHGGTVDTPDWNTDNVH